MIPKRSLRPSRLASVLAALLTPLAATAAEAPQLLFHVSADEGLVADPLPGIRSPISRTR